MAGYLPPLPRLPAADRPIIAPGAERPRLRGEVPAVDPPDIVPGRRSRGGELVHLDADGDHRGVLEEHERCQSHRFAAGQEAEHVEPDLQCNFIHVNFSTRSRPYDQPTIGTLRSPVTGIGPPIQPNYKGRLRNCRLYRPSSSRIIASTASSRGPSLVWMMSQRIVGFTA